MDPRENIFHQVLSNEGVIPEELKPDKKENDKTVDLKKEINNEVEGNLKISVMEAREVFFEQERVVGILKNKFAEISDKESFDKYCKSLGISEGAKEDLRNALPSINQSLKKDTKDFFESEISYKEHKEYLNQFLQTSLNLSLNNTEYGELINEKIRAEIDLAVKVLDESRNNPVLSHRGRGFHPDEASVEGFKKALEENIAEIEFDIRGTKAQEGENSEPVIHHNATLGASAGIPEAIRNIHINDIKNIDLKHGGHICSLEHFFELIKETDNKTTKINIDIKDFDEGMLDKILKLVESNKMEHRVAIVSWLPQSLQYLYEKNPTLSYSMSYFPAIRGVSRWAIEKISQLQSGSLLFGTAGTWFAKKRDEAIQAGVPKVQSTGSEQITDAIILDANEHWTETKEKTKERGQSLFGKHTIAYAKSPTKNKDSGMDTMARILQNGSVNIMAFEELFVAHIKKIPVLNKYGDKIVNLFERTTKLMEYAKECSKNGIKVNIFDLKKEKQ